MAVLLLISGLIQVFSQFSSPSDECDSCKNVCLNIFKQNSILIQDTIKSNVIFSGKSGEYYVLQNRIQTYQRLECNAEASSDRFIGSNWALEIHTADNDYNDYPVKFKRIYFGKRCNRDRRDFVYKRTIGKVTSIPEKAFADLGKFSWKKVYSLGLPFGASTCECGLTENSSGEDAYLAKCRLPGEETYVDLKEQWIEKNNYSGNMDDPVSRARIDYYSGYDFVQIGSSDYHGKDVKISLDTLSEVGSCKAYGKIKICITKQQQNFANRVGTETKEK